MCKDFNIRPKNDEVAGVKNLQFVRDISICGIVWGSNI